MINVPAASLLSSTTHPPPTPPQLENIFLDAAGRVRLGDFGLTMSARQEAAISPVGTVEYMAPEVRCVCREGALSSSRSFFLALFLAFFLHFSSHESHESPPHTHHRSSSFPRSSA
jgi:hypothetical protein